MRKLELLGTELARRGFTVCTGGYRGVMEAVSRGAKEAGGRTLGVTAEFFASRTNKWVDEEIRVKNWRDRLFELVDRGHGYVVCRGGTGTLVELAVVWEMLNKGVMRARPVVAMGDFWDPVVRRVAEVDDGYRGKLTKTQRTFGSFRSVSWRSGAVSGGPFPDESEGRSGDTPKHRVVPAGLRFVLRDSAPLTMSRVLNPTQATI